MKTSEFRQLIREEIRRVLKEANAPKFRDLKAQALYGIVIAAVENNKAKELQQTLEDYGIELYNVDFTSGLATTNKKAFMKKVEDAINSSNWDAISKGDIRDIKSDLGQSPHYFYN